MLKDAHIQMVVSCATYSKCTNQVWKNDPDKIWCFSQWI